MAYLPATVTFPEPGTYVRYWDQVEKRYKFLRLVERDFPYVYPRRLSTVAPGGKTSRLQLREIRADKVKKHRYMAYVGVQPGAYYYIFNPYDVENLRWDEQIDDIDRDMTGWISYEESPYDAPTKFFWVQPQQFPAVEAINVHSASINPEIIVIAAKYQVLEESDLDPVTLEKLRTEVISSIQISFGGSW